MALFPSNNKPAPKRDEKAHKEKMAVGTHDATIVYAKHDVTKTGKVRFAVLFETADEKVCWANIIAPDGSNPKHTRMFYGTMARLAVQQRFLDAEDTTADAVAEALVGAKALVTVADEEWQGNTYRKVTWIDAPAPFGQ